MVTRGAPVNLEEFKQAQIEEILKWADKVSEVLTPEKVTPKNIKEYPSYIETSEKLKKLCRWRADQIEEEIQNISDVLMDAIENQEYIFKLGAGGMPVTKKKYNSKDKRERELRFRLNQHAEYPTLKANLEKWEIMYADWMSHEKRLHRELRILETDYLHSGGEQYNLKG